MLIMILMYLMFQNTKVPSADRNNMNNLNPSKAPTNKKTDLRQLVQPVQSNPSVGEPSTSNQILEVIDGLCTISHTSKPPF